MIFFLEQKDPGENLFVKIEGLFGFLHTFSIVYLIAGQTKPNSTISVDNNQLNERNSVAESSESTLQIEQQTDDENKETEQSTSSTSSTTPKQSTLPTESDEQDLLQTSSVVFHLGFQTP